MKRVNVKLTEKDNGKYLAYFDDKEEAVDYMHELVKRYAYSPEPISISQILREQEEKGIEINRHTFTLLIHRLGFKLRRAKHGGETTKIRKHINIHEEIAPMLEQYPNQSYIVELGLKIVLNIPTEDIVMFPDDELSIIFRRKSTGVIYAEANGKLNNRDRKTIRTLLKTAEEQDSLEPIKQHCEYYDFKYVGGTL